MVSQAVRAFARSRVQVFRGRSQHHPGLWTSGVTAEVFAGELTDLYARATPRLVVPNGNDAWYLADLLEHHATTWGGWSKLLAQWQANREAASQLRVYSLAELAPSSGLVRKVASGG